MLDRIPIRIKLVGAFALAMSVLVIAGGIGIHFVVASSIDRSIDQGLRARIDDLSSATASAEAIPSRTLVSEETSFAQVLAPDGRVIASSERFAGEPVLTRDQIRQALKAPIKRSRDDDGTPNAVRILATRAAREGKPVVVLVGTSLHLRKQTLHDLRRWLYAGGALGISLATLLGYLLSARAFGSMDRIRRAAEGIDHQTLGTRLPEPAANDELRALTRTLNDLLARIDSAFERERRFIGDASHELRTPVALIKSELEVALLEPFTVDDLDAARIYIDMMRRRVTSAEAEADNLTQLANSLLIVAQEDEHAHDTKPRSTRPQSTIDLTELLRHVALRFEQRAHASHRSISVLPCTGDEAHTIAGDPIRIEQAVANLVDNALRYGAGDILLSTRHTDDISVDIHVRDDGPGIPQDLQTTAFDRFARGEEARSTSSGAGLGLAIVKMVAESHGGAARIGPDSHVVIHLPTHEAPDLLV